MKSPQQLLKILIKSGFSISEIAERTGITAVTLWRIRRGKVTDPRWSTTEALFNLYETLGSFDDLEG